MQIDRRMMYLGASGAAIKQSLVCFAMALGYSRMGDHAAADKAYEVGKHNLDRATLYITDARA